MKKNSRLKDARLKAGLTQEELGDKIGASSSYVTMIENGKGFSMKKAKQLAEVLASNAEWLYRGNKEDPEKETKPIPNNISNHIEPNKEEDMSDPQKKIYENYIEKLEIENAQLRQENAELKGVKAKRSAS